MKTFTNNFPHRSLLFTVIFVTMCFCSCFSTLALNKSIDLGAIKSPIILKGDEKSAFRDPTAIYHQGVFYMYYTCWFHEDDGVDYSYTAMSKSRDLVSWTKPKIITPRDINLNYSSPGNVIRFGDEWMLCLQTYPTPGGRKTGNRNCRVYIMRSEDLENWGQAEMLMVKGPDVPFEKMGRLIDAYLIEDKDEPGKWWCFFDDNAANMSWSYDLKTWTYFNRINSGENVCVLKDGDGYLMFHSPQNGIGMKRSTDMKNWTDTGELITLGQKDWPWAQNRLTAGFVLDLHSDPAVGKYLMFFHAEPPDGFKKYASLGIAWSDDLVTWDWPGKKNTETSSAAATQIDVKTPFGNMVISQPVFADRTYNIRDYGAIADGVTKNTKTFADAIEACNKAGGGKVLVPAGKWLTGPIHLKSNVNLHLDENAEILFSTDFNDYLPVVFTRFEGFECMNYSPLIYASDCENIAVTGKGRLCGQGQAWWPWKARHTATVQKLYDLVLQGVEPEKRIFGREEDALRPSFIQTLNCKRVYLEGFTIIDGPMWTLHPVYCSDVIVRNVTVNTKGPNNDGLDPDSCSNVLIEDCLFLTGDDAIAIKSGMNEDGWRVKKPCENIVIRNCKFGVERECDGVVSIGSDTSGDVRNVYIHDCVFDKTARAVRIKSMRGRGGVVENVWIENIDITKVRGDALMVTTFYGSSTIMPKTQTPPLFRNIHVKNIKCDWARNAMVIHGLPEQAVENLTIQDVRIKSENGMQCSDVKGVTLKNVNIATQMSPVITLQNCIDVTIERSLCPAHIDTFVKLEGQKTGNIRLKDNIISPSQNEVLFGEDVEPSAVTQK